MHISIMWGGVLDRALEALPFLCLSQSTGGGFLPSFSNDKKQHTNLRVHQIFLVALPIPLLIMPVTTVTHIVLPLWCQSNTPLLGLLPRGEHAFC